MNTDIKSTLCTRFLKTETRQGSFVWKIKKCDELVCRTHDKEKYVVHIRALKQGLNQID